jgi:hypothetical protein
MTDFTGDSELKEKIILFNSAARWYWGILFF